MPAWHEARVKVLQTLEVVVSNLRPLMASESITDVLQLIKVISSIAALFPFLKGIEALAKKMFALVFRSEK